MTIIFLADAYCRSCARKSIQDGEREKGSSGSEMRDFMSSGALWSSDDAIMTDADTLCDVIGMIYPTFKLLD